VIFNQEQKIYYVTSISNPASQSNPTMGESAGDRELLMQILRAAAARSRLITHTLETIGTALKQRAVGVEDAMTWARDEQIIDLLDFGPPSRKAGAAQ
jgi:hypothetical protein